MKFRLLQDIAGVGKKGDVKSPDGCYCYYVVAESLCEPCLGFFGDKNMQPNPICCKHGVNIKSMEIVKEMNTITK